MVDDIFHRRYERADLVSIERIQTRSRQFAKRQATWFRGLEEVRLFGVGPEEDPEETLTYRGCVLAPNGRPLCSAKLYLMPATGRPW